MTLRLKLRKSRGSTTNEGAQLKAQVITLNKRCKVINHPGPDWRTVRLQEEIENLIYSSTAGTNITVAAVIGVLEMVKLDLKMDQDNL